MVNFIKSPSGTIITGKEIAPINLVFYGGAFVFLYDFIQEVK